jgi:glycine/D-amino acid oxidase-like deaminating enzyme
VDGPAREAPRSAQTRRDRRGAAGGLAASGRNGGFCEASLTHGHENGASRWPKEIDTLERLGRQNLDEIERTVADLGLDVQFERTGELAPAIEEHQLAWLDDWRAEAADDPDVVYLDEEAVRASVNSPTYLAAIWEKRSSALVHPARLAAELARACEERGVEIFERSHVTSLDSSSAGVTVITSGGGCARHRRCSRRTSSRRCWRATS